MALVIFVIMVILFLCCIDFEKSPKLASITDKEFEMRFLSNVACLTDGDIRWVREVLCSFKVGYKHYNQNPRAVSSLRLLDQAVRNCNPEIVEMIKEFNSL